VVKIVVVVVWVVVGRLLKTSETERPPHDQPAGVVVLVLMVVLV
jgi:hypothetical protein